jgi:diadenylate cyclase
MNDILNYLGGLIRTFEWRDVLELALIGGVVYLVYRSLRGTRGARLVRGFVFLLLIIFVGVRLVSDYLQLERVQYLYGKLLLVMVAFALIVFQPELRRSLMRLGQNPLLRLFLKEGASAFVERMVRSAATLSRNKVGGIIAVERDVRLGTLIEGGMPLDAQLTSELLVTIFWPGSPLHDMGVVIRGGRIAAAGCEFPLSSHAILDPRLGTRHRAAVGLSEETDAAVVVVSEETGNISLAEGGQLETAVSPERLKERLTELLHGAEATFTEHSLPADDAPEPRDAEPDEPTDTAAS